MLIDAHQHFWRVGENGFDWPPPQLARIHRDFEPADLEAVAPPDLAGTVVVQSQPADADTDWLLALAAETPTVLGVVGWTDLVAPHAPARIAELAERPKLKGLRPMLQALPEDDWIARPSLDPALDAMEAAGLTLDALVFTRHLEPLAALAARRPGLPIVVDHGAKPPIADGGFDPWAQAIARIAAFPQVCCKLSGLLTEAGEHASEADLAPYVSHLVACFGPERLMWGSDWPVLELRASYGEWLAMAMRLSGLSGEAMEALRHRTARRFYRLAEVTA